MSNSHVNLRVITMKNFTASHNVNETLLPVDAAFILISNLTAFFSAAGFLAIFACYIVFKEIRTTSRKLLVCVSMADFLITLATLLQTDTYFESVKFHRETSFQCQMAASVMVYSQISAALWTVAITFYLFLCVTCQCVNIANRIIFLFHIFCWIMPLVVSLSADISGVYGYDMTDLLVFKHPTACWISDRVANPLPWYLLTVEGWVMAAFVIVSFLYLPITWSIFFKKNKGKEIMGDDVIQELAIQTANEQLRFIPVIYVCTRIWGTGYFLFTRYPDDRHLRGYDWLLIIKAFGDNMQGVANAIFFCLATKQIRRIMAQRILCCCSCFSGWCRRQREIGREKWMKVPSIVRFRDGLPRRKNLDGSDLDLTGISLELPPREADLGTGEDDIIFER